MNYNTLKPFTDVNVHTDKIHVELGCGANRRDMSGYKNIGIDVVDGKCVDKVCNLGFEDIPLPDDHADFVQGIDFIEHVPKCVWENKKRLLPLAEDWWHYFGADDNLYYDQGIVTCNFKPKEVTFKPYKNKDDTLCTRLIAVKG